MHQNGCASPLQLGDKCSQATLGWGGVSRARSGAHSEDDRAGHAIEGDALGDEARDVGCIVAHHSSDAHLPQGVGERVGWGGLTAAAACTTSACTSCMGLHVHHSPPHSCCCSSRCMSASQVHSCGMQGSSLEPGSTDLVGCRCLQRLPVQAGCSTDQASSSNGVGCGPVPCLHAAGTLALKTKEVRDYARRLCLQYSMRDRAGNTESHHASRRMYDQSAAVVGCALRQGLRQQHE